MVKGKSAPKMTIILFDFFILLRETTNITIIYHILKIYTSSIMITLRQLLAYLM